MNRMMSYVLIAIALYGGIIAFLYFFQRTLMYHPSSGYLEPGSYGVPELKKVEVETADGHRLVAWFKPPSQDSGLTLLYLHGNAGHIGHRAGKVKPYLDAGYGLLLLSYRGYGTNQGYPTERNLYIDGQAALNFLSDEHIPIFKTVIYGESLGTGVAVEIAQNQGIAGLVLEAPFSSMVDAAGYHFKFAPASLIVRDKYDSLNKINNVRSPLLIIHGEKDRTVPINLGRKLYNQAIEPKEFIDFPLAGHNDLYDYGAQKQVLRFLQQLQL